MEIEISFEDEGGRYDVVKDGRYYVVCHFITPDNATWGYQGISYFSPGLEDFIKVTHPKRYKTEKAASFAAKALSEGK